jgi:hypothetical protein
VFDARDKNRKTATEQRVRESQRPHHEDEAAFGNLRSGSPPAFFIASPMRPSRNVNKKTFQIWRASIFSADAKFGIGSASMH